MTSCGLDEFVRGNSPVSSLHRDVAEGVTTILRSLDASLFQARVESESEEGLEEAHVITILPKRDGCSRVKVYLYIDPIPTSGTIGVAAGENVYFNVPEDVQHTSQCETAEIVVSMIRGIIMGRLQETILSTAANDYRWKARLETDLAVFELDRTDIPRQLRGLLQKGEVRTVRYAPYAGG